MQAIASGNRPKLATQALSKGRTDAVRLFLGASWELQADERRGHLQEMTTTQVAQTSAVLNCTVGLHRQHRHSGRSARGRSVRERLGDTRSDVHRRVARIVLATIAQPHTEAFGIDRGREAEFAASISELSEISREIRVFGVRSRSRGRDGDRNRRTSRSYFKTQVLAGMLPATYQGVALLLVIGVLGLVQSADVSNVSALGRSRPHHAALLELRPGRAIRISGDHRRRARMSNSSSSTRIGTTSPRSTLRGTHSVTAIRLSSGM